MNRALKSEIRKVFTTRMWWILFLTLMAYMGIMAALLSVAFFVAGDATGISSGPARQTATMLYNLSPSLGYVFPLVLGSLAVTAEYRHQTMTSTFLTMPRRSTSLWAKAITQTGIGAAYGIVGLVACVGTTGAVLLTQDQPLYLANGDVLADLSGGVAAMALWALVGVGFGALVRNQVIAVVAILAFTQLVEPMLRVGMMAFEPLRPVVRFLPGAAGDALAGGGFYGLAMPTAHNAASLDSVAGGLVLLGYGLALTFLGAVSMQRRDVS